MTAPAVSRPSARRGDAAIAPDISSGGSTGDGSRGGAGWAKAPDYRDQPWIRAMLEAATAADRHEYLEAGFSPVACIRCGTTVQVKKTSPAHTCVQWTSDARTSCPHFAALAPGHSTAHLRSCPDLRESIQRAVANGALDVPGMELPGPGGA